MRSSPVILVVYENGDYFQRIRAALEPAGYVLHETNANEAVAAFERLRPGFVLLCPCTAKKIRDDLTLQFKQLDPSVTVLFLDPEDEEQLRKLAH
jgi:CheY-like chemotaxis protein